VPPQPVQQLQVWNNLARVNLGVSFYNYIGLDLVLEGGGYNGYWVGGLQLLASPEFHF
jgi:hypothetical protein